MKDTAKIESGTPTIWLRVIGAIILVAGFWMMQNLPGIFFGDQSIGPLVIFVLPLAFGLPFLPIYFGTHFLFFPKDKLSKNDESENRFTIDKKSITAFGIFCLLGVSILMGGANRNWRSWPTADGEVVESSIEVLSNCDTECWELYVIIQFEYEGMNWRVSYDERFPSLADAEAKENKINDMESVVVAFEPASLESNHYFPEIENRFYVDNSVVAVVSGILALGLGVADIRRSKISQ
ncbi:MAG: hypothetical protein L7S49_00485 [Candidatus Poseidoniaceae archaeon]|nr:hypothetical protein [Candidatus Poseidoniaceae archaeon]